jgi:hypothetical protein
MFVPYLFYVLWHIDPMLGNDHETIETTTIALQQLRKYATVLKPLLCSGPRAKMEAPLEAVFPMWSALRLYHSTERRGLNLAVVKHRTVQVTRLSQQKILEIGQNLLC